MSAKKSDARRAFDLWRGLDKGGREEFDILREMHAYAAESTKGGPPQQKRKKPAVKPPQQEGATA